MAEILDFPVRPELPGQYPKAAPDADEAVGSPGVEELADGVGQGPLGAQGLDLEAEARVVRQATTKLILGERGWWRVFERAAAEGQIGLPERAGELADALRDRGLAGGLPPHVLRDAVEALVAELALDLLPDSPAASWERLLARVRADEISYDDPAGAVQRLAAADPRIFRSLTHLALAESDQAVLLEVSREVWRELRGRGHLFEPRGFSDFVWRALREVFPSLPGASWDASWAGFIYSEVLQDAARHMHGAGLDHDAINTAGLDAAFEEMRVAENKEDRVGFREAARRAIWEGRRAAREAAP